MDTCTRRCDLRRQELAAFHSPPPGLRQGMGNRFSTHPPLEQRIAALSRLETQLQQGR